MRVAGILVNYRTAEMTACATAALLEDLEEVGPHHVYVVDNDSRDGSVECLQREARARGFSDRVTVIAAPRNGGYGYGINLATAHALARQDPPDYVYVINSDAFPDRGALARLCAFMDENPETGIAGGLIHGPAGEYQGAAFRFPTVWSELDGTLGLGVVSRLLERFIVARPLPRGDCEVDWLPGTSMIIRREAFEHAGPFDEGFFLYFEETDFCRRLRSAGFLCHYVAGASFTHIGCVSTGMLDHSRRMPRYWFESRHRYFVKHHGLPYAVLCDAAWAVGFVLGGAKRRLQGRRSSHERPHMLRDFLSASARDLILRRALGAGTERSGGEPLPQSTQTDERAADEMPLLELILEDFATHGRDPLQPGFWGVLSHRIGRRARASRVLPARIAGAGVYHGLSTAVDWMWGISLPRSVKLGRRVRLWHSGCMLLRAREIGDDAHIRHATTFGPVRAARPHELPVIEARADIGSGVCVLGGVTVGHDALIGANSVVMKNVPPRATVLGVPARVVPI
jgi:N-acetylglucosaminyl-diphospho-decaprenol L-rhamnosyltransferase